MGGRLKIPKTHISIQKACEELKVTEDQFKKLIIHLNIRAENVRSIYKLSCSDANTYSLKDVNRIYNSRLYATMQKNNQREMEKKLWQGRNRDDIADRMHDLDYDYVNVISNKYASFSDAVGDLGETLTFLYIYQFFNKQMNDDEGLFGTVNAELAKFERFITENMLIKSVYPTKKGLHLLLRIGVIEILFFVPLSSNFTDLRRKDLLPYIKLYMYHLMMVNCKIRNVNIDVLTNTSSKDVIGKENGNADKTVNKDRMGEDVKRCTKANKIFQNLKICIGGMVLAHWLKMLCLSAGGEITDECDYFVTEGKIDQLNGAVSYVHPSFIVNSYNQGSLVDKEEYLIGKGSVEYLYPFESHNKKYDKDFIDTLSKTKRKNVSEYLENIRKSTYFS